MISVIDGIWMILREVRMAEGNAVYCDDCGREKMAEVRDGKIVIVDRRHGRRHVAVIPLSGNSQLAIKN